ncbi:MAG TPA: hypothetical protein PKX51_14110 [Cyclobacteriaceae bacterium]|nr:hypothetical protein [Cyclobacteriaceae bacterium]
MTSTSETGHARNVAAFEDLISFCTAYGASYNPAKAALKTAALTAQLTAATTAVQAVKVAKTAYDNATNARELAFKPLKPLVTRVVNAMAASEASKPTLADVKSVNNKIQGKRAKAVAKPDAKALAEGATPVRTASASQQSFDKLIDNFTQLIATVSAEPKYVPNENDLKVPALNALLADMKAKNSAVINANTVVSNARIARDKVMYDATTGLFETALAVKVYVKSVYGATSPQYKQVGGLKFSNLPRN